MEELLLNVIFPIYILIFLGYAFGKIWKSLETRTISTLVLYIFAPALIFDSFRGLKSFENLTSISLSALIVFLGVYSLSLFVEGLLLKEKNPAFELSSTVMNAGYLGIPLIYLMFGEKSLPIALTYMVVMAVYHFTLGIVILNRDLSSGFKEALKIPLIYAVLLAFLLREVSLPSGVDKMIKLTGNATMPLMLVSIGISLSKIDLKGLEVGVLSTLVRFLGGTVFSIFSVEILGLKGLISKVLIVQSSLPSAVLNYVLCERFNKSPEIAASSIFISTILFPIYLILLKLLLIYL